MAYEPRLLRHMSRFYWGWGWSSIYQRRQKAYTTTTERKSFGELLWPQRKTFQVSGGYTNPMKTRKTISTTGIFPLWPPFFSTKKNSALEQGGVCFLFPSILTTCSPANTQQSLERVPMSVSLLPQEGTIGRAHRPCGVGRAKGARRPAATFLHGSRASGPTETP